MILNKLLLISLRHRGKWVVFTSKLARERFESFLGVNFDLVALLLANTRAEWELGEIATNTNTGALDHFCILFGKGWAIKLGGIHVAVVFGIFGMSVVLQDYGVEKRSKLGVALVG